jgi:hypothetical protein
MVLFLCPTYQHQAFFTPTFHSIHLFSDPRLLHIFVSLETVQQGPDLLQKNEEPLIEPLDLTFLPMVLKIVLR